MGLADLGIDNDRTLSQLRFPLGAGADNGGPGLALSVQDHAAMRRQIPPNLRPELRGTTRVREMRRLQRSKLVVSESRKAGLGIAVSLHITERH